MNWKKIFKKKTSDYYSRSKELDFKPKGLSQLLHIMIFNIIKDDWRKYTQLISDELAISKESDILEIGCGSGAWLYCFYNQVNKVYGIDFLDYLIIVAKNIMPNGEFEICEANKLPYENNKFNSIMCNSVFQYFKDNKYTYDVLREIDRTLKENGSCAITDIHDIDKKFKYEKFRMKELNISQEEWNKRYSNVQHLYFEKAFFEKWAINKGYEFKVLNSRFNGYPHSKFRFDFFFYK